MKSKTIIESGDLPHGTEFPAARSFPRRRLNIGIRRLPETRSFNRQYPPGTLLSACCLLLSVLLPVACYYSAPARIDFYNNGVKAQLTAHSKAAEEGSVNLGKNIELKYEPESAQDIPPDSSIVIEYTLPDTAGAANTGAGQAALQINFAENVSYDLPLEFSFLNINTIPQKVFYVMPVHAGKLGKFSVRNKAGSRAVAAGNGSASVDILSVSIEKRKLGFEMKDRVLTLSPFVYIDKTENLLFINPDEPYSIKGSAALDIKDITKDSFFISRYTNSGYVRKYQYVSPGTQGIGDITVPHILFPPSPYPFVFSGTTSSVMLKPEEVRLFPVPVPCDPGVILSVSQDTWRDPRYEVYSWDIFPSVLIFDMADYRTQGRMLTRLAFFSEKKGYRGRIVRDEVLEGQHGWNAHDYSAQTLAAFFNAANKAGFPLLEEERELEAILMANGVIIPGVNSSTYTAGEGAVISISRESSWELRLLFINHECFHGIFFVDGGFRDFSVRRVAAFDNIAKRFIRSYFDYMNYDLQDNYLWVNEFMAYCLQQPSHAAGEYFGKYLAAKIDAHEWRRAVLPEKDAESGFWLPVSEPFSREAAAFSSYVQKRWGLSAGRVWRIKPLKPAA